MNSPRLRFFALSLSVATAACAAAPQPPAPETAAMDPPPAIDVGAQPPLPPGFFGVGLEFPLAGSAQTPGEAQLSPRSRCLDEIAHEAGLRAYIAAKLNLSAAQRALWQRFERAAVSGADTRRKACANFPMSASPTPSALPLLIAYEKELLAARLAELIEIQPTITAVYNSLSPEQRAMLDPPPPPAKP